MERVPFAPESVRKDYEQVMSVTEFFTAEEQTYSIAIGVIVADGVVESGPEFACRGHSFMENGEKKRLPFAVEEKVVKFSSRSHNVPDYAAYSKRMLMMNSFSSIGTESVDFGDLSPERVEEIYPEQDYILLSLVMKEWTTDSGKQYCLFAPYRAELKPARKEPREISFKVFCHFSFFDPKHEAINFYRSLFPRRDGTPSRPKLPREEDAMTKIICHNHRYLSGEKMGMPATENCAQRYMMIAEILTPANDTPDRLRSEMRQDRERRKGSKVPHRGHIVGVQFVDRHSGEKRRTVAIVEKVRPEWVEMEASEEKDEHGKKKPKTKDPAEAEKENLADVSQRKQWYQKHKEQKEAELAARVAEAIGADSDEEGEKEPSAVEEDKAEGTSSDKEGEAITREDFDAELAACLAQPETEGKEDSMPAGRDDGPLVSFAAAAAAVNNDFGNEGGEEGEQDDASVEDHKGPATKRARYKDPKNYRDQEEEKGAESDGGSSKEYGADGCHTLDGSDSEEGPPSSPEPVLESFKDYTVVVVPSGLYGTQLPQFTEVEYKLRDVELGGTALGQGMLLHAYLSEPLSGDIVAMNGNGEDYKTDELGTFLWYTQEGWYTIELASPRGVRGHICVTVRRSAFRTFPLVSKTVRGKVAWFVKSGWGGTDDVKASLDPVQRSQVHESFLADYKPHGAGDDKFLA